MAQSDEQKKINKLIFMERSKIKRFHQNVLLFCFQLSHQSTSLYHLLLRMVFGLFNYSGFKIIKAAKSVGPKHLCGSIRMVH